VYAKPWRSFASMEKKKKKKKKLIPLSPFISSSIRANTSCERFDGKQPGVSDDDLLWLGNSLFFVHINRSTHAQQKQKGLWPHEAMTS
jgi:hypothetical protein